MPPSKTSLNAIQEFLDRKRIAFVGVSREPKDFSSSLFAEFVKRGYDVIPVNPNTTEVMGRRAFPRVQDIQPPVDGALLMTSPAVSEAVVADCAQAGVRHIWLYRATGEGAVSTMTLELCQQHGMKVIPGECPFMFFPNNGFHAIHGFVRKIIGTYPKNELAA